MLKKKKKKKKKLIKTISIMYDLNENTTIGLSFTGNVNSLARYCPLSS